MSRLLVDQPKQNQPALRQNSFVRDLVEDPCEPPAVEVLVGYLGNSSRKDENNDPCVRLYFTLDFTNFVDIAEKDVLYNERSTSAMLPRQGTILWIRSDAKIWHTRIRSQALVASDFLRGRIMDEHLPEAEPTLGRPGEWLVRTPSYGQPC